MLEKIRLKDFTVFHSLEIKFSKGINIFIGENGTGKTHLLKILYTPLSALSKEGDRKPLRVSDKLANIFLPKDRRIGRLVRRQPVSAKTNVSIWKNEERLNITFSNHTSDTIKWNNGWKNIDIQPAVYIPVKEMLANAPKFISLYNEREIYFEEVYADIIIKSFLPLLRGPADKRRKALLLKIRKVIDGKVVLKNDQFYLKNKQGELEFTLLAEGMRKLGLLWILIQNGTLQNGATLFWDEPEANLNPKLMKVVIDILLELQRAGVQIFIATHSYSVLKEFDLQKKKTDNLMFTSLYRNDDGKICHNSVEEYIDIDPSSISDAYADLFDREMERSINK